MIGCSTSTKFRLIHDFLQNPDNQMSVIELCEIASVSRSGFYRWKSTTEARERKELQDQEDFECILQAYKKHGYYKGARRIHMTLLHMDTPVLMNLKKIRRLMKKYGLKCPIRRANPYKRTRGDSELNQRADYILNRRFTDFGPRLVLLTDITYIPYKSGHKDADGHRTFAYLSTIIDAFTREVLSYSISTSLKIDFVLETVNQLMANHKVSLTTETLINSDQGCHYTSHKFGALVKNSQLRQSMSHKACCWDNAPQESFFGHMKDEINVFDCNNFEEVKSVIDQWIAYYNHQRYQWQLAKLSPCEFYQFITTGVYPIMVSKPPKAQHYMNKFRTVEACDET